MLDEAEDLDGPAAAPLIYRIVALGLAGAVGIETGFPLVQENNGPGISDPEHPELDGVDRDAEGNLIFYHYSDTEFEGNLRPNSFVTNIGGFDGATARSELALNKTPTVVYSVKVPEAEYGKSIVFKGEVEPAEGQPGRGFEWQFVGLGPAVSEPKLVGDDGQTEEEEAASE